AGSLERPDDVQQRRLARPGRPDDRHQLAPPDGEGHPSKGGHRGLLTVDLGDLLQLQYRVAHIDGTATESPAWRSPSTWTRQPPDFPLQPGRLARIPRRVLSPACCPAV